MKPGIFLSVLLICTASSNLIAQPSINKMQECQAFLNFMDKKISHSSIENNDKVRQGLKTYNNYIQKEIITPLLKRFNAGNLEKSVAMQTQINAFKSSLVESYQKRYPQKRLLTDYAVMLNNCTKLAVPSGNELEQLKYSLNAIVAHTTQQKTTR